MKKSRFAQEQVLGGHRRFGNRRLGILLAREGVHMNHKKPLGDCSVVAGGLKADRYRPVHPG